MAVAHSLFLLLVALVSALTPSIYASRFAFELALVRTEECFQEEVLSRSSGSKMLLRFGIVEPTTNDMIDVTVRSPTNKIVQHWARSQTNYTSLVVRETGLYSLCFRKVRGSAKVIHVFYNFDVVKSGSVVLTRYPELAVTVDANNPQEKDYTRMNMHTVNSRPTKMGVVAFDLSGVSSTVLSRRYAQTTRAYVLLSIDKVIPNEETVEIAISDIPFGLQHPVTWNSLGSYAKDDYKQRVFDSSESRMGSHLSFDITEKLSAALARGDSTIQFAVYAYQEEAQAAAWGAMYAVPALYPQMIVEHGGLDLMEEIAIFKEIVFELRGDLGLIKQKERSSRDAAESVNSRVKWMSLLTNIVLVGIAFVQVLFIRSMLESTV